MDNICYNDAIQRVLQNHVILRHPHLPASYLYTINFLIQHLLHTLHEHSSFQEARLAGELFRYPVPSSVIPPHVADLHLLFHNTAQEIDSLLCTIISQLFTHQATSLSQLGIQTTKSPIPQYQFIAHAQDLHFRITVYTDTLPLFQELSTNAWYIPVSFFAEQGIGSIEPHCYTLRSSINEPIEDVCARTLRKEFSANQILSSHAPKDAWLSVLRELLEGFTCPDAKLISLLSQEPSEEELEQKLSLFLSSLSPSIPHLHVFCNIFFHITRANIIQKHIPDHYIDILYSSSPYITIKHHGDKICASYAFNDGSHVLIPIEFLFSSRDPSRNFAHLHCLLVHLIILGTSPHDLSAENLSILIKAVNDTPFKTYKLVLLDLIFQFLRTSNDASLYIALTPFLNEGISEEDSISYMHDTHPMFRRDTLTHLYSADRGMRSWNLLSYHERVLCDFLVLTRYHDLFGQPDLDQEYALQRLSTWIVKNEEYKIDRYFKAYKKLYNYAFARTFLEGTFALELGLTLSWSRHISAEEWKHWTHLIQQAMPTEQTLIIQLFTHIHEQSNDTATSISQEQADFLALNPLGHFSTACALQQKYPDHAFRLFQTHAQHHILDLTAIHSPLLWSFFLDACQNIDLKACLHTLYERKELLPYLEECENTNQLTSFYTHICAFLQEIPFDVSLIHILYRMSINHLVRFPHLESTITTFLNDHVLSHSSKHPQIILDFLQRYHTDRALQKFHTEAWIHLHRMLCIALLLDLDGFKQHGDFFYNICSQSIRHSDLSCIELAFFIVRGLLFQNQPSSQDIVLMKKFYTLVIAQSFLNQTRAHQDFIQILFEIHALIIAYAEWIQFPKNLLHTLHSIYMQLTHLPNNANTHDHMISCLLFFDVRYNGRQNTQALTSKDRLALWTHLAAIFSDEKLITLILDNEKQIIQSSEPITATNVKNVIPLFRHIHLIEDILSVESIKTRPAVLAMLQEQQIRYEKHKKELSHMLIKEPWEHTEHRRRFLSIDLALLPSYLGYMKTHQQDSRWYTALEEVASLLDCHTVEFASHIIKSTPHLLALFKDPIPTSLVRHMISGISGQFPLYINYMQKRLPLTNDKFQPRPTSAMTNEEFTCMAENCLLYTSCLKQGMIQNKELSLPILDTTHIPSFLTQCFEREIPLRHLLWQEFISSAQFIMAKSNFISVHDLDLITCALELIRNPKVSIIHIDTVFYIHTFFDTMIQQNFLGAPGINLWIPFLSAYECWEVKTRKQTGLRLSRLTNLLHHHILVTYLQKRTKKDAMDSAALCKLTLFLSRYVPELGGTITPEFDKKDIDTLMLDLMTLHTEGAKQFFKAFAFNPQLSLPQALIHAMMTFTDNQKLQHILSSITIQQPESHECSL